MPDRPVRPRVVARRRSPAGAGRGGRPHAARRGLGRRPLARPRVPGHGRPALAAAHRSEARPRASSGARPGGVQHAAREAPDAARAGGRPRPRCDARSRRGRRSGRGAGVGSPRADRRPLRRPAARHGRLGGVVAGRVDGRHRHGAEAGREHGRPWRLRRGRRAGPLPGVGALLPKDIGATVSHALARASTPARRARRPPTTTPARVARARETAR